MRKLLWIIFVIPFAAHAQFNKGDTYVGANISGFNGSSFGAAPFFGYFINQHTSVGAYVRGSSSKHEYAFSADGLSNSVQVDRSVTAALTARRWYTLSDKFYFALQGEVFYDRQVSTTKNNNDVTNNNKYYNLGLNIIPTFLYFPISRLGIEASVGGLQYQFTHGLSDEQERHQVTLGLGSMNLGVAYYFRK
ncbi:MAG TPA: hypothetical protein VIU12_35665 [Chryseolinea sp.]